MKWFERMTVVCMLTESVRASISCKVASAEPQFGCSSVRAHGIRLRSFTWKCFHPDASRTIVTWCGENAIRRRSRDKRDTIDLVQGGFTTAHKLEGRFAQAASAELARGVFYCAHRL